MIVIEKIDSIIRDTTKFRVLLPGRFNIDNVIILKEDATELDCLDIVHALITNTPNPKWTKGTDYIINSHFNTD